MNNDINIFHHAENNFFSVVSVSRIDYGNLIAYATGVQTSGLNPAIVVEIDGLFSQNLNNCQNDYAQKKLPWAHVIPERPSPKRGQTSEKTYVIPNAVRDLRVLHCATLWRSLTAFGMT